MMKGGHWPTNKNCCKILIRVHSIMYFKIHTCIYTPQVRSLYIGRYNAVRYSAKNHDLVLDNIPFCRLLQFLRWCGRSLSVWQSSGPNSR